MPSLKDVKMKIVGVGKTKQITKAMNMVASAKLRGAQARIERFRPYAGKYRQVLAELARKVEGTAHPLLAEHEEKKNCAIVLVTSDRGLCGSFNGNIITTALKLAAEKTNAGMKVTFACMGRKGRDAVRKAGYDISVNSSTTTRVIEISVESGEPQAAATVANKIAEVLSSVEQEVMGVESVNIVDEAKTPEAPSGPNRVMYTAVAFLAGLLVVMDMVNTRVRTPEEAEELLGVPVIGRIPKIKG
mgnify:CR=1 FL=1